MYPFSDVKDLASKLVNEIEGSDKKIIYLKNVQRQLRVSVQRMFAVESQIGRRDQILWSENRMSFLSKRKHLVNSLYKCLFSAECVRWTLWAGHLFAVFFSCQVNCSHSRIKVFNQSCQSTSVEVITPTPPLAQQQSTANMLRLMLG